MSPSNPLLMSSRWSYAIHCCQIPPGLMGQSSPKNKAAGEKIRPQASVLKIYVCQFLPIIVKIKPQLWNLELGHFVGCWFPRPQVFLQGHFLVQQPRIRPSANSDAIHSPSRKKFRWFVFQMCKNYNNRCCQEFNSHYQTHSRRTSASQPPLVVNRVKVTFQNEPGKVLRYFSAVLCIRKWLFSDPDPTSQISSDPVSDPAW